MNATPLHILKTDPIVFQALVRGLKNYEIRYNDRNFQVGDILELQETVYSGHEVTFEGKPVQYTGNTALRVITHILTGYGLKDGWVVLNVGSLMDSVALPTNVDQAKMMTLLGMDWLERHAPEQIKPKVIDYDVIHTFSRATNMSYNELCKLVRDATGIPK